MAKKISDKVIDEFSSRANWTLQIDAEARTGARALTHGFLAKVAERCSDFAAAAKRKTYTLLDVVNSMIAEFHDEFGQDADVGEFLSRAFGVEGLPNKRVYTKDDLPAEPNMHCPGTTKAGEKRNLINSLNALRPNEVKTLFRTSQNAPSVANVFAQRAADEYAVLLFCAAAERALNDKKKRIAYKHLLKDDSGVDDSPQDLPAPPDGLSVLPAPPDGLSVLPAPLETSKSVKSSKASKTPKTPKVQGAKKATKSKKNHPLPMKIKIVGGVKPEIQPEIEDEVDPFADDYRV